jgi:hypothetical protein
MLPLVLARRDGGEMLRRARAALADRPPSEHDWLDGSVAGWELSLASMRIDVYDLGMAVMNGTFDVRPPPGVPLQSTARTLKRLVWLKPDPASGAESPLSAMFRDLAAETTSQFSVAVGEAAPDAVQAPWLSPFLDALRAGKGGDDGGPYSDEWGRLLWLHPVYFLTLDEDADVASVAARLAPPFHRSLEIPDGLFVPGIGWSAITARAGADTTVPLHLIELHWAYIALYMEMDRGLLALLDDDRWHELDSLVELEDDAHRVFSEFMRVMEARARLDSELASLGGDEFAMWETIADVTRFDALVDGVDRKVEVLQQVAERRVQQAAASRARRTSAILGGLTALTLVTVAVALIGNFLGTRSDPLGHLALRTAIVAAAFIAALMLYREAHRDRARGGKKRRKPPPGGLALDSQARARARRRPTS